MCTFRLRTGKNNCSKCNIFFLSFLLFFVLVFSVKVVTQITSILLKILHNCVEGDRGAGARENGGREGYGRREEKGREAGLPKWREPGEKEKNFATLHKHFTIGINHRNGNPYGRGRKAGVKTQEAGVSDPPVSSHNCAATCLPSPTTPSSLYAYVW